MLQKKKRTGKGHTLFDQHPPTDPIDLWILISESCYEISKTLLSQQSYAEDISVSFSGYDARSDRGGFSLIPKKKLRYPDQLFHAIHNCSTVHDLIQDLLFGIRRVQVSVLCGDYIQPIFEEHDAGAHEHYNLVEEIRENDGCQDIIGIGIEGFRKKRLPTYTAKKSDDIHRAKRLLESNSLIVKLMNLTT
jgi:glutaredoxin